jgi:hypothetical protein
MVALALALCLNLMAGTSVVAEEYLRATILRRKRMMTDD